MGRRRTSAEIARDRRLVADLYLRGYLQSDIAEQLGVNQSTVSRDLKALHQEWLVSAQIDFNQAKARELARIDRLEREYWRAWEKSKNEKESTVTEKVQDDGRGNRAKARMHRERQFGNPRFLVGVQWCIEQRCKLLGVYAPQRIAVSTEDIDTQIERELERLASEDTS
jgi:DNA-binding MarR family transcriptional regulator